MHHDACHSTRPHVEPRVTHSFHCTLLHTTNMTIPGLVRMQVVLFCDLHGHSRKPDIFVYGCQKVCCMRRPTVLVLQINCIADHSLSVVQLSRSRRQTRSTAQSTCTLPCGRTSRVMFLCTRAILCPDHWVAMLQCQTGGRYPDIDAKWTYMTCRVQCKHS
jgi:hypothetical protein